MPPATAATATGYGRAAHWYHLAVAALGRPAFGDQNLWQSTYAASLLPPSLNLWQSTYAASLVTPSLCSLYPQACLLCRHDPTPHAHPPPPPPPRLPHCSVAFAEVVELLEAAEAKATYGLAINWKALQALTEALLERGTLQARGGAG